jgi:hypothetical protein
MPDTAPTSGYAQPIDNSDPPPVAYTMQRAESDAWQACWDEARTDIPWEVSSFPDGGPRSAGEDKRYQEQVPKWSACMAESGYDFENPQLAMQAGLETRETTVMVNESYGYSPPTDAELVQAKIDMDCKIRTNLIGYWLAVQTQYDNQWIQANQTELQNWRQQVADLIAGK